jgi:hypothetical protein
MRNKMKISERVRTLVISITAWLGTGANIILGFTLPDNPAIVGIGAATAAAVITIENLIFDAINGGSK